MATLKPKGRSFEDTRRLVSDALRAGFPTADWLYITELYADMAIFSVETEKANPRTRTYSSSYSIDKDDKVTVTDQVEVVIKEVYETASFSVDVPAFTDSDFQGNSNEIVKECVLFKVGNYPDKGISVTTEELDEIVIPSAFGVKIVDEHPRNLEGPHKSKWVGKLGKVINAWKVTKDGEDWMHGNVAFSKLVAEAFKGEKPRMSVSFHPGTKKLREVSLVDSPYFEEAGPISGFSKERAPGDPPKARTGKPMSFFATLAEKLGITKAEVESGIKAEFSNENASVLAKLAALEAENTALKQGVSTFGAATADATAEVLVKQFEKKILPAFAAEAKANFLRAIVADNGVNFSATGEREFGPNTKSLITMFEKMPDNPIFSNAFSIQSPASSAAPIEFKSSEKVMAQLDGKVTE